MFSEVIFLNSNQISHLTIKSGRRVTEALLFGSIEIDIEIYIYPHTLLVLLYISPT